MAATRTRPLSPHLSIWRWGPHMLASILHRGSGMALSTVGLAILVWWLTAIAEGAEAYDRLAAAAAHPAGLAVLIGLTLAFFLKLLLGMRHLVMDTGAGFEINTNKRFAIGAMIAALVLTAALWAYFLGVLA